MLMLNLKRWFLTGGITAAIAMSALTGCKSTHEEQAEGRTSDKKITSEVHERLKHEPAYKFNEVTVKTFDGVVQLSGFVQTSNQKLRAEEIARGVYGVSQVVNNISLVQSGNLTPTGKSE